MLINFSPSHSEQEIKKQFLPYFLPPASAIVAVVSTTTAIASRRRSSRRYTSTLFVHIIVMSSEARLNVNVLSNSNVVIFVASVLNTGSYCHQPFSSSSRNVNIVEKLELPWAAVSRGVPWIITSCAQELQRPSFKMTRECFVLSIPSEPRKRWVKFCFHHFNNLNLGFSRCSANRYSLSCISERFSIECR